MSSKYAKKLAIDGLNTMMAANFQANKNVKIEIPETIILPPVTKLQLQTIITALGSFEGSKIKTHPILSEKETDDLYCDYVLLLDEMK